MLHRMTDILSHNRKAWNAQSLAGESRWVQPVDPDTIARARRGDWQVILTPTLAVPRAWFGDITGRDVLCLASGGGQQAPVLAAAGGRVVSFDNSEAQLDKDRLVADRDGVELRCVQGDMADLSIFDDGSFDLVFHPVSNVFAPAVRPVWLECYRVLRPAGRLLAGFMNPAFFLFDHEAMEHGEPPLARFPLPFSDLLHLPEAQLADRLARLEAVEFSHSLDDQIGGQIDAGFTIHGFYEDRWSDEATPLNALMPTSMATLAIR